MAVLDFNFCSTGKPAVTDTQVFGQGCIPDLLTADLTSFDFEAPDQGVQHPVSILMTFCAKYKRCISGKHTDVWLVDTQLSNLRS